MFLRWTRHLAIINESDTKVKKICAKEANSIDKQHNQQISTQGGHLKCNKVLMIIVRTKQIIMKFKKQFLFFFLFSFLCPVVWACRIHWTAPLQRGKTPPNECPGYDTKQSDCEVPVILGPWVIRSPPSLPLLPGPLLPGVVAPDRALSMG